MRKRTQQSAPTIAKARTGVLGLDVALQGGIPAGRSTLLVGGSGAGKTILSLQSLAYGARECGEAGILVAFEESSARIVANAAPFGWGLSALSPKKLFLFDAQPHFEQVRSGDADLTGLLAMLDARIAQTGARRIVFDAVDIMLYAFADAVAERRELYRLHAWLLDRKLTAIVTCRAGRSEHPTQWAEHLEFMMDCAIVLDHRWSNGVSQRNLRVLKYRGSDFHENDAPFVIGDGGLEVATLHDSSTPRAAVTSERVSTGVARLDDMLEGGYFRGASILVTGTPGTAKTTLCGTFVEAACERGERSLMVSFDSDSEETIRNLLSVGIRLERFRGKAGKPGLLQMLYARSVLGSAEMQLMQIKRIARAHEARCVVIDPVSVLAGAGNASTGAGVAERLIDWAKSEGVTLLCSSLLDEGKPGAEHTPLQVSTIADTWIHLDYQLRSAERNRGISILKSRGTAHSSQVRELLLSRRGVTLADAYSASGEVLMGTMRWEHEQVEKAALIETDATASADRMALLGEEADLAVRLVELQTELKAKRASLRTLEKAATVRKGASAVARTSRLKKRGADDEPATVPPRAPTRRAAK